MAQSNTEIAEISKAVREEKTWFITIGILMIVLGTAAIIFPHIATLSTNFLIGWLLVVAGILQFIHAFRVKEWSGFAFEMVIALLHAIAGIVLLVYPVAGVIALTIYLAVVLIIEGIFRSMLSLQLKPESGWVWMLVGGIASVILGILLWAKLPSSAAWAIGLLVGLNIAIAGWTLVMLALSAGDAVDHEVKA